MEVNKERASNNLRNKTVSGIAWTAVQKYSTMIIQFVSGIILARLLTPYDYGCIGMLSIFMVLAEAFIDCGFGAALIQKKNPTQEDYSTIFYWNIAVSVLLYLALFFAAPFIAKFYNIPLLSKVLRIQGVILFIYALNIIQSNQLRKKMNFRLLSIVSITTAVISLTITIILAYNGAGVWALVAQNIIMAAIPCLVYWFYVKWRPILTFSIRSFKELFEYGFYVFLSQLINQFGQQIQGLLIGKMYSPTTMGYYSKAMSTENMASKSVSQIMTQVTFPLYANVQDDLTVLSKVIKRVTMSIAYVTFPVLTILIILAKPLFLLLYSDRWLPCVPYFQVLCVSGFARCLLSANLQAITAIGKSKIHFYWTIIRRGVGVGFIIGGMFIYGIKGLLIGVVLSEFFSYFVNAGLVSRFIGYKWWDQIKSILPILIVSIVAAGLCYLLGLLLNLSIYHDAMLKLFFFLTIYLGWSILFKPESYNYLRNTIEPMLSKIKKINKHV